MEIGGRYHAALFVVRHSGIAPAAVAAEPDEVVHAELGHGPGELLETSGCELVVAVGAQMFEFGDDDLTEFAQGAGDERDAVALRGISRHGGAGGARLVVGVGMNEHQSALGAGIVSHPTMIVTPQVADEGQAG
ncbi:hypothetical protein GCM10027344_15060 [Spelaeicoccus albus]